MFRLSQFIDLCLRDPSGDLDLPQGPLRMRGPVVIWNLIRRCNLTCRHCYTTSADIDFPGELSTQEVLEVMGDLWAHGVRVLILSGGEPLLRPDLHQIARTAKSMGFYTGLSSNGTLITPETIGEIEKTGFDYVGISLDGLRATHDHFRQQPGSFEASLAGVSLCRSHGIRIGIRMTLTQSNAQELPAILELMEEEGVDKFYLSHLNYGGRGLRHRDGDAAHEVTRKAMDLLFETTYKKLKAGHSFEIVTGNNDADGAYLLMWVQQRFPDHVPLIRAHLRRWGGNASGINVANIDNLGEVHPDTFWWHYPLGNVRDRPFSEIWSNAEDPLMLGLRQHPRPIKGRCAKCQHLELCNGNTRVRAHQILGDFWAEDPGCYLSDAEIGVEGVQSEGQVRSR